MKNDPTPIFPSRAIAANGNRILWTTCEHFHQALNGEQSCLAPGQQYLFSATSCAKCKQFSRRDTR
jgi:hypothetical protein